MAMMTLCAYCYWCSRSSFSRSKPSKCSSIAFLFTSEHTPPYLPLTGETQTLRHGK
jgi:hypothetical protein